MDADGWGLLPEQEANGPQAAVDANLVEVPVLPQPGEPFIELNDFLLAYDIGLDLNVPLEEDLGGIDDLVQAAENMEVQPQFGLHPEDIIDAGNFFETDLDEHMLIAQVDQEPNIEVEVFIPQEQINPDEIQADELMDVLANNVPPQDEHLQLGFVELLQPEIDPVFMSHLQHSELFQPNAEAVRLCANFFAPGSSKAPVMVPRIWADFFTALLFNPSSFAWAKQFMLSEDWHYMDDLSTGTQFALPEKFPGIPTSSCLKVLPNPDNSALLEEALASEQHSTPPTNKKSKGKEILDSISSGTPIEKLTQKIKPSSDPWSKAFLDKAEQVKKATLLEDPLKRRSLRMQNQKRGFKDPQCPTKGCLGCTVVPPSLSPTIIKNLGASFCQVDEKERTVTALHRKKKVTMLAPGGKKAPKKKIAPDSQDADESKKNKKRTRK
ncbi:hypothetical protein C2845_PM09G10930 [Panicum miliaceum]|uniref:Uncharacterized protein n=1 Tax=Panicum miliaceum TaxID=4540 RepID=A0A3L6RZ75_PANMI|nr:hypothetical protein C2845_PM09G10930 [Panicum miliaceum]